MAVEIDEAVLFIVVGIVVGVAIIFVVMQSRVSRKAQLLYDGKRQELENLFAQRKQEQDVLVEQRKNELDSQYKNQYTVELEKWKAEFKLEYENEMQATIKAEREKALNSSRSSLKGKINEQIAPLLPEFTSRYVAADARFIGSPVDFIVFKNLHTFSPNGKPQPLQIVFVEVKTGNSALNRNERAVRDAIDNFKVKYEVLKITTEDKAVASSITEVKHDRPSFDNNATN